MVIVSVKAGPGQYQFLDVSLRYRADGDAKELTYVVDDWREGALTPDPVKVAQGLAALIRAEVREQADTTL